MSKRYKMNRRQSKRYFSNAADLVHRKNMLPSVAAGSYMMRGGIRF